MKKRTFTLALFLCAFAIFIVAHADLSGKWAGKLIAADGTKYPLLYNLSLVGNSIIGTAKSPHGEFPIEDGKLDIAGFHFKLTVNGLDIPHSGKFYGDSVGMDISLTGSGVHTTLVSAALI